MIKIIFISILTFCYLGCGVKGDPLPPLEPISLGTGEPSRPTKKFEQVKPPKLDFEFDNEKEGEGTNGKKSKK